MTRSLADHLAEKEPDKFCNFRDLVEHMPGDERQAVLQELREIVKERKFTSRPFHTSNRLSRILNDHGYIISSDVINHHLNGKCCCSGAKVDVELGNTPEATHDDG